MEVDGEGGLLTERTHFVHAFLVPNDKRYFFCLPDLEHTRCSHIAFSQSEPFPPMSTWVDIDKIPRPSFLHTVEQPQNGQWLGIGLNNFFE